MEGKTLTCFQFINNKHLTLKCAFLLLGILIFLVINIVGGNYPPIAYEEMYQCQMSVL